MSNNNTPADDELSLDSIFTEPPRPPTPDATVATYTREGDVSQRDWIEIKVRLVGAHPLWGHYLWNAARAIATYLDENQEIYHDMDVLELGAGGALPSIVAIKNGARRVVVTDYPDKNLVANMTHNVDVNIPANGRSRVSVQGYIWGRPVKPLFEALSSSNPGFNLIILSDLIFNHSQHDALLTTCELAVLPRNDSSQPSVLVFYTHHRPHLAHRDMEFFTKAHERGWVCEEVCTRTFAPMFPEDPGEEAVRSTVHGWRLTRS